VAESDSTEGSAAGDRLARLLTELPRDRQVAGLGALAVLASLLLPWYAPAVGVEVVKTGLSEPGFAHLALTLTVACALVLIFRAQRGFRVPPPLHEGTLLALAGAWSALIFVYLMIDRPDFEFLSFEAVRLRYGIFVGLAGAVAMLVAGLRLRGLELAREEAERE
jgi:hypothetical protein